MEMKHMPQSCPFGLPGKKPDKEKRRKMPISGLFFRGCFF